jgi:ribosome-binding factor A
MSTRSARVASELERMLNDMLRREIKDPRLAGVQVTNVDVSGDLGVAKAYYALLDPNGDPVPVADALASATGFMRRNVGRELSLRRVPELPVEASRSVG